MMVVITVASLVFAALAIVLRDPGVSQRCFLATQLVIAETPADDRQPIPDTELERVCGSVERFDLG